MGSTEGVYFFWLTSQCDAAIFFHSPEQELMAPPLVYTSYDRHHDSGAIALRAGLHQLRVEYHRYRGGPNNLDVEVEGPDLPRQPLPASWLFRPDSAEPDPQ